jgi:hypothetical protein
VSIGGGAELPYALPVDYDPAIRAVGQGSDPDRSSCAGVEVRPEGRNDIVRAVTSGKFFYLIEFSAPLPPPNTT